MTNKEKQDSFRRRFMSMFDDGDGCWNWRGGTTRGGYGVIRNATGKMSRSHRESYKMFVGEIPDGMLVCHKCDNPKCVNPTHLFIGTHKDNTRDMLKKGRCGAWKRDLAGTKNPNSRLSDDDVARINDLLLSGWYEQQELAEIYGVHRTTIKRATPNLMRTYKKGWVKI